MIFSCYQVNYQHRNQNSNKSQWTAKEIEELLIFSTGLGHGWCNSSQDVIWSLPKHIPSLICIGNERATKGNTGDKLFIAKFTGDSNGTWHGYPVSAKSKHDHPPQIIINEWINNGFIDKRFYAKWVQGKLK